MVTNIKGSYFIVQNTSFEDVFTPEDFTKEHKAISKSVKEFVDGEIKSLGNEIEHVNNELSRKLMLKAGEIGLLAADIPQKFDGLDLDKVSSLIISEKFGEGSGSFAITELNHTGIGTLPLTFFGTENQRKKYLPGLSSGKLVGAFGLTEPDAGSDALNAKTTAVLCDDGKHYIINGSKIFITNAGFADLIFVFAKVDGEAFTAFIVEFNSKGLSVDNEEVKMGMKGTSTRSVIFKDVKVPAENVLGQVGKGNVIALNALNMGRFKVGAVCIGNARGVFNEAVKYSKQRVQFGKRICEFGLIKAKISEMAIRLFAGESMMYRTADLMDKTVSKNKETNKDIGQITANALKEYMVECGIMKIYGSEAQGFVVDESLQIFGGYGYIYENPAELAYRNARINRIWEGTNEINRLTIANTTIKRIQNDNLKFDVDIAILDRKTKEISAVAMDDPNNLRIQELMVEISKKVLLFYLSIVFEKSEIYLKYQQEHSGNISDMIIAIYALESVYLRSRKILAAKGGRNKDIAVMIAKVLSCETFNNLCSLISGALPALRTGDLLKNDLQTIQNLLRPLPINTIAQRSQIAEICVRKNGYPFRIGY
jgi:alkylation response protein AidB-like acyl-CoA dehydrogenase